MKLMKKWNVLFALAAAAFVAAPRASATAELILSDGIAADTQTVAGTCTAAGCVASFNGAVGSWNINVTTGTSDLTGNQPIMDLNSIDHHNASSSPSTLTLTWTATDFAPAQNGWALNIGGTIGSNGTLTASLYGGTSNNQLDESQQLGSTLSFSNPPIAFSGGENAFLNGLSVSPYSLTEVATITFGKSAGQASFDYSVDAIPEPAGVLLLGSAILFTVSMVRRKTGQKRA